MVVSVKLSTVIVLHPKNGLLQNVALGFTFCSRKLFFVR